MAKVSGPLFSIEASGAYAGAVVFAKWKGRQYARQLVIPANPHSATQESARNSMRVAGAIQRFANANAQIHPELTLTDKAEVTAVTPAGFAWNGYLVTTVIGSAGVNIAAAQAIFDGLTGAEQTAWDNAAAALNTLLPAVSQTVAGGGAGTALTNGNVFLIYMYALYVMGLTSIPTAVPPTYV